MSITGIWNLSVAAPVGTQHGVLELIETDGDITGSVKYAGQTLPLINSTLNGTHLTWRLSRPDHTC
jgi:hypothetical protein